MDSTALSAADVQPIARLPAREVLHAQLVGTIAAPITGLVRGLNALIAGLAIQLQAIADQGSRERRGAAPAEAEPEPEAAPSPSPRRGRRRPEPRRRPRRAEPPSPRPSRPSPSRRPRPRRADR